MWKRFLKFSASSLSAAGIDLLMFAVFCRLLRGKVEAYIAVSTVLARVLSACYNYTVNHKLVFQSEEKVRTAGTKYLILAVIKTGLSAVLVSAGSTLLPAVQEVLIKMVVDTALFFASFLIQQAVIF